jgi:hypothetical protein
MPQDLPMKWWQRIMKPFASLIAKLTGASKAS